MGPTNEMLVTREDTSTLIKYDITGGSPAVVWEKPVTWEMLDCSMFISPEGQIILYEIGDDKKTTHVYSTDFDPQSSHDVDDDLQLYNVSSDRLLYRRDQGGHYSVEVYNMTHHECLQKLSPSQAGRVWMDCNTVVSDAGDVVLVDHDTSNIDIFSHTGMYTPNTK